MSGPSVDPAEVTTALGRVMSVEGVHVWADSGRLRSLLMDELGSSGRRHRAAVDAMCALAADVGGQLVQASPHQVEYLLGGWLTSQRMAEPALARWAADAVRGVVGARPNIPYIQSSTPVGPQSQYPGPPPDPAANSNGKRLQLLAVAVLAAVIFAGGGFAAGTTLTGPDTSVATTRTETVTETETVVSTAPATTPPPVIAAPGDIHGATIAGTWPVTLTAVDCAGLEPCPAYLETSSGRLFVDCTTSGCTGTYDNNPVNVAFDAARAVWVVSGALPENQSFSCQGVATFTAQDWVLQVTQARLSEGTWQATALEGQRVVSSQPGACLLSYITSTATTTRQ